MLSYKGFDNVSICGDSIIACSGEVIARATSWQEGSSGLVAVDSDNEAGEFIAENTGGLWDGKYVHSSGCVCEFCNA